jgi:hypothetical protein
MYAAGCGILASVDMEVLSNGILAVDSEMWGSVDLVDYIFGISGGNLSHSSSILSQWLTVDLCARTWNLKLSRNGHSWLPRKHV